MLKNLDILEEIIGNENPGPEAIGKLEGLARFFATELELHLKKEEEALFPEIEKHIPREGGPTGVMLMEHEELRQINPALQQGVASLKGDRAAALNLINKEGRRLVALLREHIQKENDVLFPMAEELLTEAQQARVQELFARMEESARS